LPSEIVENIFTEFKMIGRLDFGWIQRGAAKKFQQHTLFSSLVLLKSV